MSNRIQTVMILVIIVLITLTYIYYQAYKNHRNLLHSHYSNDPTEYLKELNELRYEFNILKKKMNHIEQIVSLLNLVITFIETLFSYLKTSFILYLLHLCLLNSSATQTMKLIHIVNIISYSVISMFYTAFKHMQYSGLSWLICFLLLVHFCIR